MFVAVEGLGVALVVPRNIVERLREEARRLGVSLEEYLADIAFQNLDPHERAIEYIKAAEELLKSAREELAKGDVRLATEKVWGAAALAIKAYASRREGKVLTDHGEMWEFMRLIVGEIGSWIREAWMYATSMHVCFYEGWCGREDVEESIERVRKLVEAVKRVVCGS
jgi:HEPN domain-containing protein